MSLICFVILNYNGFEETIKLVHHIVSWDPGKLDYSVVVVDNSSTDDSFRRMQMEFVGLQRVTVIQSERNGGYSYGNNFGVEYAMNCYHPVFIAIANPDVDLEQDTVIHALETFQVDEKIAMCAPVMKSLAGSFQIHAQRLPTYRDDLAACWINYKPHSLIVDYETLNNNSNFVLTEMLSGSFFVIRADRFTEIGMFDENVFLYCEERILGRRLKDSGYIAVLRADLFYTHAHATSTSKAFSEIKRWRILLKSRFYYQKKYGKINLLSQLILKIAMKLFLVQLRLVLLLREIIKRVG